MSPRRGLLSLLLGMAVTTALLTAGCSPMAWFLGCYLNASGGLVGWDAPDAEALRFRRDPGRYALSADLPAEERARFRHFLTDLGSAFEQRNEIVPSAFPAQASGQLS
jgi:hypothetical protein